MLRVREIMTGDVVAVSPETTLRDAMELLAREHVSGAPVLNGRTVVGVVSTSDLLAFASTLNGVPTQRADVPTEPEWDDEPEVALDFEDGGGPSSAFFSEMWNDASVDVSERMAAVDAPEWNALEAHDVSEVMTNDLWSLPSDADAKAAADLMRDHGIHRVLVVDDGNLVGIVSSLDIAKAVSDRRFTTRTYVFNREY
jgi:CBS domain-containing protein